MGASNLAIVFGPTLLSPPIPASTDANGAAAGALHLQDMSFQCKAIETILEKYKVRSLGHHPAWKSSRLT